MYNRLFSLFLLAALLIFRSSSAQQYAFQVTFTDKNNTPFSLSSPSAYLSARAQARRARQSIAVDSSDLPVNAIYVDSVLHLTGGVFYETSRWLNSCVILLGWPDSAMILNLAGKSFISGVQLVGAYCDSLVANNIHSTSTAATERTTNDDGAYYGATWGQTLLVNGNYLYDNGYNGQGMLIAVLDAGFIGANTHPYLDSMWAAGRMVDSYDFTYQDDNIYAHDDHGMLVLSTMAGYAPGTFVGTAPLAMYALYITENDVDDEPLNMLNMIAGAERADSVGADVITESLGYDLLQSSCTGQTFPENFDTMDGKTTVAAKAANFATTKGMLFVATAGNDGGGYLTYGDHIMTPGDADSALTIGAVDPSGMIAPFSGFGPNAAGLIKPDVCAVGDPAEVCNSSPPPLITTSLGTSFSTPQVAGWAACMWQSKPSATPYQIRQAIIMCASDYNSPGPQYGYGIPNFACADDVLAVQQAVLQSSAASWIVATPNPFSNEINVLVHPDAGGEVDFSLFDIAGQKVSVAQGYFYGGNNAPLVIPATNLPPGVYILKATSATQQQTLRLVKTGW